MESKQILDFEGMLLILVAVILGLVVYNTWGLWRWLRSRSNKPGRERIRKFETYLPGKTN